MKLGILISLALVVAIIAVLYFTLRGVPENPTTATRAENLELRTDLGDLPKMYEAGSGNAWTEYQAIFEFYRQNRASIDGLLSELTSVTDETPNPPEELSDQAIELYLAAYRAGTPTSSELDSTIKLWPNAAPEIASPESVALLAMLRASYLYYEVPEQKARALETAKAVWCVGQTMYEKSNRVAIRQTGLEIIKTAATELFNWSEDGSELGANMWKWEAGLNAFEREYWMPKTEIVYSLKPNIGDLLNVALHDKDLSWKIEATLALGRIKWNPRTRGNRSAVLRAIKTLMGSSDPTVKAAAEIADKFSVDDLKSMN